MHTRMHAHMDEQEKNSIPPYSTTLGRGIKIIINTLHYRRQIQYKHTYYVKFCKHSKY